jgi:hypothetical protein
MHYTQHLVAGTHAVDQNPKGDQVVHLVKVDIALLHFPVDAVQVLDPAKNLALNPGSMQLGHNGFAGCGNIGFPFANGLTDLQAEVGKKRRLLILEG